VERLEVASAFFLSGRIWLAVSCAALLSLIAAATLLVNHARLIDAAVAVRAR
jgi:hypothetical protein